MLPTIKEQIDCLEETMQDTEYEIEYSKDQGHKTAASSFLNIKRILQ